MALYCVYNLPRADLILMKFINVTDEKIPEKYVDIKFEWYADEIHK